MDLDPPWPWPGCRSRFNGAGVSLSSYALVFAGCTGLYYVIQWRRGQSPLSAAVHYFLILALVLAPWIIWTKFVLQIPADLITQNFSGGGTELAWTSPINFVWIRLQNLFYLIGSQMFFDLSL